MLLYQTAPNLEESLERVMLDDDFKELQKNYHLKQFINYIEILNQTQQEMRWTNHARYFLEVAIVKLCQLKTADCSISMKVAISKHSQ